MKKALVQLALRVKHFFGNSPEFRMDVPRLFGCYEERQKCEDAGDGFCGCCGLLMEIELSDEELE